MFLVPGSLYNESVGYPIGFKMLLVFIQASAVAAVHAGRIELGALRGLMCGVIASERGADSSEYSKVLIQAPGKPHHLPRACK